MPTTYAFLPCVMSTSGRIHGEFLRLLYILAHRRTVKYFADTGGDESGTDADDALMQWVYEMVLSRYKGMGS